MEKFEDGAQPDHSPHVRKVTLPSGRSIEVVRFDNELVSGELEVCRACRSRLVYPLSWEEASDTSWRITLRCPNCEWTCTDVFEEGAVERFDAALDRGTKSLAADLRQLARANMEEDVERFAAALAGDHVLPEDF